MDNLDNLISDLISVADEKNAKKPNTDQLLHRTIENLVPNNYSLRATLMAHIKSGESSYIQEEVVFKYGFYKPIVERGEVIH